MLLSVQHSPGQLRAMMTKNKVHVFNRILALAAVNLFIGAVLVIFGHMALIPTIGVLECVIGLRGGSQMWTRRDEYLVERAAQVKVRNAVVAYVVFAGRFAPPPIEELDRSLVEDVIKTKLLAESSLKPVQAASAGCPITEHTLIAGVL